MKPSHPSVHRAAGRPAPQDWRPSGAERAFSWFPGHMRKAQQRLGQELKKSDLILELRDARLPIRSANPDLQQLLAGRPRLVLFNKASLADPQASADWQRRFDAEGLPHLFVDADSRRGLAALLARVALLAQPGRDRLRARGIRAAPPRVVVVGLPNVGKSTLINRLAGRQRAQTAPTPGVTRHLTWIQVDDRFELLDSPGIMLPRIASQADALALTWIGAVKDTILGAQLVAQALIERLLAHPVPLPPHSWWPKDWRSRSAAELLEYVARQRGFLTGGGAGDPGKTGQFVLDQYRAGNLGRMTFDAP